jgi:TolB-like protein/DNA-binding winged helix-turn-helix (wHTH) protein
MDSSVGMLLRVGAWRVDPRLGEISRDGQTIRLEARAMRLLLRLAERPGEIVSTDDLLNDVWSGVIVTQDSVYQAVASLRRVLGDDAKRPTHIVTVPRLGYRMVASVRPWDDQSSPSVGVGALDTSTPRASRRVIGAVLAGVVVLCVAVFAVVWLRGGQATRPSNSASEPSQQSIAVMPFLDLTTQEMNEEYFADGLTEEVIGRLSKIPGLSIPSPASSFYFKDKHATVGEIGKALGVAYLMDGSIRQSDANMRIGVRLVRVDDGYVVWSQTYEKPRTDKLRIQDEVAGEIARELATVLERRSGQGRGF